MCLKISEKLKEAKVGLKHLHGAAMKLFYVWIIIIIHNNSQHMQATIQIIPICQTVNWTQWRKWNSQRKRFIWCLFVLLLYMKLNQPLPETFCHPSLTLTDGSLACLRSASFNLINSLTLANSQIQYKANQETYTVCLPTSKIRPAEDWAGLFWRFCGWCWC